MKSINKFFLIIIVIGLPFLSLFYTIVNKEVLHRSQYVQKLRDVIDLCERLNWDSYYVEHDLKSLDWYVAEMVNDNVMTEEEANNTIFRFILENSYRVTEIKGKSDIYEYGIFKDTPEILMEWFIIDLYDENYFFYNYTYDLLLNEYGESTKPFILMFDINLMSDLVDDFESKSVNPLDESEIGLVVAISLQAGSIALLSFGDENEIAKKKKGMKRDEKKSIKNKILDILKFRFVVSLILYSISLYFIIRCLVIFFNVY